MERVKVLNWQLRKVTKDEDSELQDSTTGEATAEMGELVLQVGKVDYSAVALAGDQFEKNTSPIVVLAFTHTADSLTLNTKDNVLQQARGDQSTAGLVKLSTNSAAGVACATDDARLSDDRVPDDASVTNVKVRTPGNTRVLSIRLQENPRARTRADRRL